MKSSEYFKYGKYYKYLSGTPPPFCNMRFAVIDIVGYEFMVHVCKQVLFFLLQDHKAGNVCKRTDFGYYLTNSKMNNVEYGDFPMLKVFYFSSQDNPKLTDNGYCIRPVHP